MRSKVFSPSLKMAVTSLELPLLAVGEIRQLLGARGVYTTLFGNGLVTERKG